MLSKGGLQNLTVGGEETAAKLQEVFGKSPPTPTSPACARRRRLRRSKPRAGRAPGEELSDEDFQEQLQTLNEELEALNAQARELEQTIAANVAGILEG